MNTCKRHTFTLMKIYTIIVQTIVLYLDTFRAFVGGGFHGNETVASGVQHLVQSAQNVNQTIDTTEDEVSRIGGEALREALDVNRGVSLFFP